MMSTLEAKLEVLNQKKEPFFRDLLWVTKNGEIIPFRDLKDDHLHNIINFLERKREGFLQTLAYCEDAVCRSHMEDVVVCCSPDRGVAIARRLAKSSKLSLARCDNQLLCLRQEAEFRSKL